MSKFRPYRPTRQFNRHFKPRAKVTDQRNHARSRVLRTFLAAAVILGGTAWAGKKVYGWASSTEAFKVKKVSVAGLETITEGKFREYLPDSYRNNILFSYFVNFDRSMKRYFPQIKWVMLKFLWT